MKVEIEEELFRRYQMNIKQDKSSQTLKYPIKAFGGIKKIGNLLGQQYTLDILLNLSNEPMRYTELKSILKCSDTTLSRRLKKLLECKIIEILHVTLGNKKTHEYTITDKGQELVKFFKKYELDSYNNVGR